MADAEPVKPSGPYAVQLWHQDAWVPLPELAGIWSRDEAIAAAEAELPHRRRQTLRVVNERGAVLWQTGDC